MVRFRIYLVSLLVMIFFNYLSNAIPFNGQTTSEITNRLTVLFTPAGYVFSIWGLIYILLGVWIFRQVPKKRRELSLYVEATPLFVLSCILNIAWLFSWHYEFFITSIVIMGSLLITLTYLYRTVKREARSYLDVFPFSIYLAWICVATVANISYVLVYFEWGQIGLSSNLWAIIMLVFTSILAITFRLKKRDPLFSLVFVWAFIGIGTRNLASFPLVAYAAFFCGSIVLIITLIGELHH